MIADLTVLVRPKGKKKSAKLEFFRGTKFICNPYSTGPQKKGPGDKFRVRVNRKWIGNQHTWMTFLTVDEVTKLLNENIHQILD